MKKSILTCFLVSLTTLSFSQVFEVDTIVWSGLETNRINMVILSDGYQQSELTQFAADASSFTASMFSKSPYKEYANYFNVFAVRVPSNESGASHPGTATDVNEPVQPVIVVDNYFGSAFDSYNIHRLLVPNNYSQVISVLANNYPTYDIPMVLVNSPYYGGSGGQFASASLDPNSDEVAIHELGHSFVDLNDEYYAGDVYASEAINMTQQSDPDLVRWTNWTGSAGISVYPYGTTGNASNWYRPHQHCKMKELNQPFCAVCREGTTEKIHSLVSLVDSYSPQNASPVEFVDTMNFKVHLVKPIPNTLQSVWTLNGDAVASNVDSLILYTAALSPGTTSLSVMIEDTTQLLRVDNHETIHFATVLWTVDATSGIADVSNDSYDINLFPNPATDELSVKLSGSSTKPYTLEISDIAGRRVNTMRISRHDAPTDVDISSLPPGVYLVSFRFDDNTAVTRKIVKN